ncbi:chromosome partitioning protein ParA [Vibrio sp. FNV 38]|nr:chromosome partitioning protein ParA [Vibrio sp. FNV 38]
MFDLTKALSKKIPSAPLTANGIASCTLFYQSNECLELVQEIFKFEGWNEPSYQKLVYSGTKIADSLSGQVVILELNESKDVVKDAKAFATQLPTQKGVVVLGKEDSISTMRSLKDMGFYYVFWPVNKPEFSDFLTHVNKNLQTFTGVSQKRKAKRVAFVGCKGGTGTSIVSTELSSLLSTRGIDTILVDHQYAATNIDILLALKAFKPRTIDEFTSPLHEMDEEGALNYLHNSRKNLRLLSINGDRKQEDLLNYSHSLCELLTRNANFIVEDLSGSVDFKVEPQMLNDVYDVVVLVLDASVSAVRNAKRLYEELQNIQLASSKKVRILTVVNYHRPAGAFVLKKAEVEKYLTTKVDLEIGFCKALSHIIVDGKRAHKHDRSMSRSIDSLAKLISGQQVDHSGFKKYFKRASHK